MSTQGSSNISIRIYVCTDIEENLNKANFKKWKENNVEIILIYSEYLTKHGHEYQQSRPNNEERYELRTSITNHEFDEIQMAI